MHTHWAQEFPHQDGIVHLNHAGIAPWPKRTTEAIVRFANENSTHSSRNISEWEQTEAELRSYCQRLINAKNAEDIAFLKSTSEGLSIVAYGIEWQANDNVVYAQQEFPSNRIVWESLQPRFGVEARSVDISQAPEDALFNHVDKNTRLISISAVQYACGIRMDLAKISDFCSANNILLCIDAIQMLGAIPFDLAETPADFVVADGHKWLLSPEGITLFYCNPEIREQLLLNQYGWHMVENSSDFECLTWQPAKDARRFECGSANNLGIQGLHASLDLILDIGVSHIYEKIFKNISYIYEKYKKLDVKILSDMEDYRRSGIITAQIKGVDNHQLFKHLIQSNVLCAHRKQGIRLSPHFYNREDEIDEAFEQVNTYMRNH